MQRAINKKADWGSRWGFRISVEKTKYVVFGNKKAECQGLSTYGKAIQRVKVFKFLGVLLMKGSHEKIILTVW